MDGKKLEILMTAVDLGSFSKASEVVGYTQSGLTHMMDALEKEIGFPLLKRTHMGIELTKQGEQLMPAIRDFLKANAILENQIQNIVNEKEEVIRISAYASIAMHWLPELLYRFKRICPDVIVDLRMVDDALEPYELLEAGLSDVIFASKQNYNNCNWIPLYNERLFAIVPKDYPLNNKNEFPITKFNGKEFLMPYGKFDIDVYRAFKPYGIKIKEIATRVDDETLIRMIGRRLGISMMGELMIRGKLDDVLCVPVSPIMIRELGMGTHIKKKETTSIQKLKECMLELISEK